MMKTIRNILWLTGKIILTAIVMMTSGLSIVGVIVAPQALDAIWGGDGSGNDE